MNVRIRKWWLVAAVVILTVSCSTDDGNDIPYLHDDIAMPWESGGTFDGEWVVNKAVADTARLVVKWDHGTPVFALRLPMEYLSKNVLNTTDGKNGSDANEPDAFTCPDLYMATAFTLQGYSDYAAYFEANIRLAPSTVTIDGKSYKVTIHSKEGMTAMMETSSALWTLGLQLDGLTMTDEGGIVAKEMKLGEPLMLVYNAKRRIE